MAGVWKGSEVFPERIVLEHLRLLCMVDSGLSSEGQKTSKDQVMGWQKVYLHFDHIQRLSLRLRLRVVGN